MVGCEIAVIDMNCILPGAETPEEFYQNLISGKYLIAKLDVQEEEYDNYVPYKGVIPIQTIAEPLWGIEANIWDIADPQLRLLFKMADNLSLKAYSNMGIYVATSSSFEWRRKIYSEIGEEDSKKRNLVSNFTDETYYATQLSYELDLKGPSCTIQSACASSALALHTACQALLSGDCYEAAVFGVSVTTPMNRGYYYYEGSMFSSDGSTIPFSDRSKGTVPSDGGACVILKCLEDAISDNDNILGIIKGISVNNDGRQKMGYTAPSVVGESEAIRRALDISEVDGWDFIEMHGTGTSFGDSLEVEAIKRAAKIQLPCALTSVKGNIGYLDAASGIVSLVKVLKILEHRIVPGNINIEGFNPMINLQNTNFFIPRDNYRLPKRKVIGGINSFGDGGTNVHVIVESMEEE